METMTSNTNGKRFSVSKGSVLFPCMALFALIHKRIPGFESKRWTGTIIGFFVMYFVMGVYIWQHVIVLSIGMKLILIVGPRKCHIFSLLFAFIYTITLRLMIPEIWYYNGTEFKLLHMQTLLKTVGMAFDIHLSNKKNDHTIKKETDQNESLEDNEEPLNPNFVDLFHYMFTYLGIVMGPYIRFRTYDDFLRLPFAKNSNSLNLCIQNSLVASFTTVGLQLLMKYYPFEFAVTEEFRRSHFLYKNVVNFLYLLKFKLAMSSGLLMGRIICANAGVGAYPVFAKSSPTHGPQINYAQLRSITPEEAPKLEYDFETVRTLNLVQNYFAVWHSEFWRSWNMSAQYGMARYINKELFKNTIFKNYRIVLTMFVSSIWHGLEVGYYTSLPLCGIFMMSEKSYHKIYKYTSGWVSKLYLVAMWLIQAHIFSYLMVSFIALDPYTLLIHASAMNYVPYISMLCHYLLGKVVLAYLEKHKKN